MKKYPKGFTLIELLVVIAIIGLLSSVVLASLNTSRNKGKDSAIKSQLSAMRQQAALWYSVNLSYSGMCASATGTLNMLTSVRTISGSTTAPCIDTTTTWAAMAPLKATADGNFCVDYTGVAKKNATGVTGGVCLP
jgi:type IV pilus assembly protein PilE